MEGLIRQLLTLPQLQELTAGMAGREKHSMVTGLSPVQRAAVAAAAAEQTGRPLLMLCADEQECARQAADLRALTGEEPVVLPDREWQLRPAAAYSRQWEYRRLWALYRLAQEKPRVIVTTAAAMAQLCLPAAVLQKTAFTLEVGQRYDVTVLTAQLTAAGYEHYEISNFALLPHGHQGASPYRSRHNSSYWNDVPYIGLGAAAHSSDRLTRHWNPSNILRYIDAIERGTLPYEEERIDPDTHYDDLVTTALRTREGIDLNMLDELHRAFLLRNASGYIDRQLLRIDGHHLSLTRQGINISSTIMSDLMYV